MFERCGEIEAVTDTLVRVHGVVHILALHDRPVGLHLVLAVFAAERDENGQVAEIVEMVYDRRNAERAHGGEEDRAVERADLQQELRQQAEIVHRFQHPHRELEEDARDQRQRLGSLVKIAGVGRALDALDLLVELPVDIVHRVRRLQMQLHGTLRRFGGHVLLDHHAELDIVVPAVDLLAGEEAVQRRILRHAAHIGCEEYMCDAEAGHTGTALLADIALHRRDLHRLADEVRRAAARRHDVVSDDLHRVERAQLPPVRAVAPRRVVFVVEMHLHHKAHQQARQQQEHVRQIRVENTDVLRMERSAAVIEQHAQRRQIHQRQQPYAALAGDNDRIGDRKGHVRDPAKEDVAPPHAVHRRNADAEINGGHKDRNCRPVQALLTGAQKDQHIDQGCCHRQYDLKPHRRCICAFPAEICDAGDCRANHHKRRKPDQNIFSADIVGNSVFHHGDIITHNCAIGKVRHVKKPRGEGLFPLPRGNFSLLRLFQLRQRVGKLLQSGIGRAPADVLLEAKR